MKIKPTINLIFQEIDFLRLGVVLPCTNLFFTPATGVSRPYSPSPSSTTPPLLNQLPNFFHLKNPVFFFSDILSICPCMEIHRLCSLSTSSLSRFISICWAVISRLDRHRAGGSRSPKLGLLEALKEPLQSN